MSEKILQSHLTRKALVYVRQSSAQQVLHNEESRRLQYAMQERVRVLGWSRVEVVDDDLGRSASGLVERSGFQKLVAEVCLGNVGAVAARELSRFARNSREWQQLMEVCRLVDTLLIDHESVYDTRRSNDRLLLGLKGSMNEYELDLLRLRSVEARYEKASRGEFFNKLPPGYVVSGSRLELDPDARMQRTIRLVFSKALALGSARQLHEWLLEHGLEMPCSVQGGIEWRRATYGAVLRMLKNPTYAGVYFFGRTVCITRKDGHELRQARIRQPKEKWHSYIQDHHEAYVSWQDFERVQKMLSDNEVHWGGQSGTPREGKSIVAGLLRCRRCGRRLSVAYRGPESEYSRYTCRDYGDSPGCLSFGGGLLDHAIVSEVLRVLRPTALDAAVKVACDKLDQKDDLVAALELETRNAQYAADRAQRQYNAVDPLNRLVAETLEHRWEAALQKVTDTQERLARAQHNQHESSPATIAALGSLAKDFETVWNAPATDVKLKKRIVRTLIEEIMVDVDEEASRIDMVIHWKGGAHSSASVKKFSTGQRTKMISVDVLEVIRLLARTCKDITIAAYLTKGGVPTATGGRWTWKKVAAARNHHGIPPASKQPKGQWLNLRAAAAALGLNRNTLVQAASKGLVPADHPLPNGPWVFSGAEVARIDHSELRRRMRNAARKDAPTNSQQVNLAIPTTSPKEAR